MGWGALKGISETVGLAFPVAFCPRATSSFPFIWREVLFSFEPLTPSPNRIDAPKSRLSGRGGGGQQRMEINKGVSSSRFSPTPLPRACLVLPTRGQSGQRRQQAVCQRPVAWSGSSQVPNSWEAILSLFPHTWSLLHAAVQSIRHQISHFLNWCLIELTTILHYQQYLFMFLQYNFLP